MPDNLTQTPNVPPNVQDVIDRGKKIYEARKDDLEPANNGKYVAIEVNTQEFFVGETRDDAVVKARDRFPKAVLFIKRIGGVEKVARHFYSPNINY